MSEELLNVEIDTAGMEKRLDDKFTAMSTKIEEMVTLRPEPQSLTETKSGGDVPFDYRIGVAKWLSNEMDSHRSLREEKHKVIPTKPNDLYAVRRSKIDAAFAGEYNPDSHLREYKLKESATLTETIGSVNPDCCIPEIWADDVERTHIYPGSVFWGAWFVRWERGIDGQPGDTVWICTVGTAVATTIAAACTEPTTTGATITCKSMTLTDYACAFYMCKNDIESVMPDLINELNAGLGSCLERQIDNYFFDVARTDDCTAGTLTSSSALSGSLIAEAMGSMRNGKWRKWKVSFCCPDPMSPLSLSFTPSPCPRSCRTLTSSTLAVTATGTLSQAEGCSNG